jgi:phosphonate transport system substrate-binding protein
MRLRLAVVTACLAALSSGCSAFGASEAAGDFVDLTVREDIPEIADVGPRPIRIAVAAVLSPSGTARSYAGLVAYIGEQVGRPAELVQRRTYAEVNAMVAAGEVDLAFVCTSAYVSGHERGDMDLLVVPEIGGRRVYHSSVIVRAGSSLNSVEDLKGTAFAFTDPMSLTGRIYPTFAVQQLAESPDLFFGTTAFTYSHDRAVDAVLSGVVDAAAVDDLVLDRMILRDRSVGDRLRIIDRSPDFGIPPVVVPSSTPFGIRSLYQEILLDLPDAPGGPDILESIGVDRFVVGLDEDYEGARQMVRAVGTGL